MVGAAGATAVHLGRRDALFRTRCAPAALGRVLPELVHCYPTFRFDIARGRVAGAEWSAYGKSAPDHLLVSKPAANRPRRCLPGRGGVV